MHSVDELVIRPQSSYVDLFTWIARVFLDSQRLPPCFYLWNILYHQIENTKFLQALIVLWLEGKKPHASKIGSRVAPYRNHELSSATRGYNTSCSLRAPLGEHFRTSEDGRKVWSTRLWEKISIVRGRTILTHSSSYYSRGVLAQHQNYPESLVGTNHFPQRLAKNVVKSSLKLEFTVRQIHLAETIFEIPAVSIEVVVRVSLDVAQLLGSNTSVRNVIFCWLFLTKFHRFKIVKVCFYNRKFLHIYVNGEGWDRTHHHKHARLAPNRCPKVIQTHPKRRKTSSVGRSAGLLILRSSVRFRQKLKKPRTQIYMDLRYIDPQARVLNYFYR